MWCYNIAIAIYAALIRFAALWNPKAKAWSEGRKDIFAAMRKAIGEGERVVWIHAASLGEFEQGRPIIELRDTQGLQGCRLYLLSSGRHGVECAQVSRYRKARGGNIREV